MAGVVLQNPMPLVRRDPTAPRTLTIESSTRDNVAKKLLVFLCEQRFVAGNAYNSGSVRCNSVLKKLVAIMSEAGRSPRTIKNYIDVPNPVVASVLDEDGNQLYPRLSGIMSSSTCRSKNRSRTPRRSRPKL